MSRPSWLQKIYWTHFAKPVQERQLFRQLLSRSFDSVLEIGVGDGARMQRIAKLIRGTGKTETVRYIGTDEFESAQDGGRHLSLKQAHQLAHQLGFKAWLIPGDAKSALPRVAHKLGASDLVIVNGGISLTAPREGLVGSWLNRLAHSESIVLAAASHGDVLEPVDVQYLELPRRLAA